MLTRHNGSLRLAFYGLILALGAAAQAQSTKPLLLVESDERSGIYVLGKEIVFTIKAAEGAESVDLGQVAVTITRDGWTPSLRVEVTKVLQPVEVRFTPEAPGWYMCEAIPADDRKAAARAGVLVSPEKIAASLPEPDDLDAFWNARRAMLAALPLDVRFTPVESPDPQIECVDVELPCPQTQPVRGYYACPATGSPRSAPAILYVRAAGVSGDWCKASVRNAVSLAKQYGAIVLDINAHGMRNAQPPEYYRSLEQQELRAYWAQGADDKDAFYFVGMYVRLLRAIEFIAARELWDGRHLITIGESQGGGQALAAAGLDRRVSAVVALVPAMCDFTGPVVGRLGGWPMPLGREIETEHAKKVIEIVRYCDNVNLAKRSRAETLIFVGLIDTTCSPCGIFATYNNLPGNKQIVAYPHKPHNGQPKEDLWLGEMSELQRDFIRRHIGR